MFCVDTYINNSGSEFQMGCFMAVSYTHLDVYKRQDWNKCNEDYKRMEQLYFQIAAKRYQEIKLTDLTYQIEDYLRGLDGSIQVEEADLSVDVYKSQGEAGD